MLNPLKYYESKTENKHFTVPTHFRECGSEQ